MLLNTGEEITLRAYVGSDPSMYLMLQIGWDFVGGSTTLKSF